MGALALAYESDDNYLEICEFLRENNGFFIENDIWHGNNKVFEESCKR